MSDTSLLSWAGDLVLYLWQELWCAWKYKEQKGEVTFELKASNADFAACLLAEESHVCLWMAVSFWSKTEKAMEIRENSEFSTNPVIWELCWPHDADLPSCQLGTCNSKAITVRKIHSSCDSDRPAQSRAIVHLCPNIKEGWSVSMCIQANSLVQIEIKPEMFSVLFLLV